MSTDPTDTQTRMSRIAAAVRSITPEEHTHEGFAKVKVVRVDPWSVGRVAFVISVALGVALLVGTLILWWLLGAVGVWDDINRSVEDLGATSFDVSDYLSTFSVMGFALVLAIVNVVVMTTGATLCAYLYNLAADVVGGVNITLAGQVPDDR